MKVNDTAKMQNGTTNSITTTDFLTGLSTFREFCIEVIHPFNSESFGTSIKVPCGLLDEAVYLATDVARSCLAHGATDFGCDLGKFIIKVEGSDEMRARFVTLHTPDGQKAEIFIHA